MRFLILSALLSIAIPCLGSNCPILPHEDVAVEREFQNLCDFVTHISSATTKYRQFVQATATGATTTTNTSFTDAGISATIRTGSVPSYVCIKVAGLFGQGPTVAYTQAAFTFLRDSTELSGQTNGFGVITPPANNQEIDIPGYLYYCDSPPVSTTITYKMQMRTAAGTATARFGSALAMAVMTLEEIAK